MKTKEELRNELYRRAKADLKISRLTIELLVGIPVAVACSALLFYYHPESSSIIHFSPLLLLAFLWLCLGANEKAFTKISERKIRKRAEELLEVKKEELLDLIESCEAEIELANNEAQLCKQELELLKELKADF